MPPKFNILTESQLPQSTVDVTVAVAAEKMHWPVGPIEANSGSTGTVLMHWAPDVEAEAAAVVRAKALEANMAATMANVAVAEGMARRVLDWAR